jgi:hypothetical protein
LAIVLLIANGRKKNDICRFGIKWKKIKEENKRRDFKSCLGKKIPIRNKTFSIRPFQYSFRTPLRASGNMRKSSFLISKSGIY